MRRSRRRPPVPPSSIAMSAIPRPARAPGASISTGRWSSASARKQQRRHRQPDRRHGRRSRDRRRRGAASASVRRHRPGRADRAAAPCRGAAPGDLHARLRLAQFRRRQRHRRPDAACSCASAPGSSSPMASSRRWRSSTPAICGSPSQLCTEGLIDDPPLFQLCLGIPWGAPCNTRHHGLPGRRAAAEGRLGGLRHRAQPDADGGPGGLSRRPCPGRSRGQSLAGKGRPCLERLAGRAGRRRSSS